MPYTTNRHKNLTGRNLLTTDETTTKYSNDRQINTETGRSYHTDLEINVFTACCAIHHESARNINRKKFTDIRPSLLDETVTKCHICGQIHAETAHLYHNDSRIYLYTAVLHFFVSGNGKINKKRTMENVFYFVSPFNSQKTKRKSQNVFVFRLLVIFFSVFLEKKDAKWNRKWKTITFPFCIFHFRRNEK